MTTHTLRSAGVNDTAALIELMRAAHAEAGFELNQSIAADAFAKLLRDESRGRAWLAFQGSEAAGYIVLIFKLSLESGGVDAFIEDLFVRPATRRTGLGNALLSTVIAACRHQQVSAVHVEVGADNDSARSLYEKHGLKDRGRLLLTTGLSENPMARRTWPANLC
jgi:ribosomal protein S18 acetylase RimI-like enzyme